MDPVLVLDLGAGFGVRHAVPAETAGPLNGLLEPVCGFCGGVYDGPVRLVPLADDRGSGRHRHVPGRCWFCRRDLVRLYPSETGSGFRWAAPADVPVSSAGQGALDGLEPVLEPCEGHCPFCGVLYAGPAVLLPADQPD